MSKPSALVAPPPVCTDRFLRRFGFRIHSRPKNGPATWFDKRNHRTMPQAMAYKIACERMKGEAE